jgi:hypothetical protein
VSEAVIEVLGVEPTGLRVREVHARVELLLGELVSRGSVKSTLNRLSKGTNRRLVRIYRGRYRLFQGPTL